MKYSIHVHDDDGDEGFINRYGAWEDGAEIDGGLSLVPAIVEMHQETYGCKVQRIYVRIEENA